MPMDFDVAIVGGGIHGIGIAHDLSSRGLSQCIVLEKNKLASGTSSRSTKLVHGGLRYLEHLSQWPLVFEALQERSLLLNLLGPQWVKPVGILLPLFKKNPRPPWLIRAGLFFYDGLAGDSGLPRSKFLSRAALEKEAPYLVHTKQWESVTGSYLYHDAQMQDDVIVRLAAHAAHKLGASIAEGALVTSVTPWKGGFRVEYRKDNVTHCFTTRFIVNAAGAWCNSNLLKWGFTPHIRCLLNLGSHLVFPEAAVAQGAKWGTLVQENDGRVVFFLPWFGKWLLGTTESVLEGNPDILAVPPTDLAYLRHTAEEFFNLNTSSYETAYTGVRCMPLKGTLPPLSPSEKQKWSQTPFASPYYAHHSKENISALSREAVISEDYPGLFSLYGGKYTTYRAISQKIGNIIRRRLRYGGPSMTHTKDFWFLSEIPQEPLYFQTDPSLWH